MFNIAGFFQSVFAGIGAFIDSLLVPAIFAFALIVFLYGMFNYFVLGPGEEDLKEKGRRQLLWGNVLFVVGALVYGFLQGIIWLGTVEVDVEPQSSEGVQPIPNVPIDNP